MEGRTDLDRIRRTTSTGRVAVRMLLVALSLAALLAPGCHSDREKREVEVEVRRVAIDPASRSPVVVLWDRAGGARLPIWIGAVEARAIAMELEKIESPRPLTHDLVRNMLDRTGVEFERVLIHTLEGGTYYARIFLRANGAALEIDSRPSDAIALALRFESPIFVASSLLETKGVAAWGDVRTLTVHGVTVQPLSEELAEHFELAAGQGVLVSDVAPDAVSKLRPGDVILEVDGEVVRDVAEFGRMAQASSGKPQLSVRRSGARLKVALEPLRR